MIGVISSNRVLSTTSMLIGTAGLALVFFVAPALAEAPLQTDGAETESEGAYELEAQVFADEGIRGLEIGVGYVPVENIEVEFEFEAAQDGDEDPAARELEAEFSIKWVPEQSGEGVAYGLQFGIGRGLEDDRSGEKTYATEKSLAGVFSYDFQSGPKIHFNIGVAHESEDGESETTAFYALALEKRVSRRITLAAEVYGEEHARASQALGVRYKFSGNTNLFARIGRNDERTFGSIGVAFEFEPD